jgi:predicted nuclease of predicted toxin-antitoxin system
VKFLVDNQLPVSLARWIAHRGHEAVHVMQMQLDEADDLVIWENAVREQMIIVSKDDDFVRISLLNKKQTPVIWVRLGNCRKVQLLAAFEGVWDQIEQRLNTGDILIEVF